MAHPSKQDIARINRNAPFPEVGRRRRQRMNDKKVHAPTEAELRELRKDAQEGVLGARAALGGDEDELTKWRANQE